MASGGKRRGLIFIIVALVIIAVLALVYFLSRGTQLFTPSAQPGAVHLNPVQR